ncbi:threonine and homoserine efflux system [Citrobacter koseri]|nr:threonine and homoserine efflux system [Citrobacter koseri]
MNYLFYLSIQTVPLGIAVALEFTGPLAVALFSSRRPVDFIWVVLAVLGLWFLLPLGQGVSHVDLTGAALALGAGACWAIYILTGQRAGEEHGPATVAVARSLRRSFSFRLARYRRERHYGTGRFSRWVWLSPCCQRRCPTRWK